MALERIKMVYLTVLIHLTSHFCWQISLHTILY